MVWSCVCKPKVIFWLWAAVAHSSEMWPMSYRKAFSSCQEDSFLAPSSLTKIDTSGKTYPWIPIYPCPRCMNYYLTNVYSLSPSLSLYFSCIENIYFFWIIQTSSSHHELYPRTLWHVLPKKKDILL